MDLFIEIVDIKFTKRGYITTVSTYVVGLAYWVLMN